MNLQILCDLSRKELDKPFSKNGYVYASNGKVIVRVKETEENKTGITNNINVEQFNWDYPKWKEDGNFVDAPMFNADEFFKPCKYCNGTKKVYLCPDCKGEGYHQCTCGHEHYCPTCNGKCYVDKGRGGNEIPCDDCKDGLQNDTTPKTQLGSCNFANWLLRDIGLAVGKFQIYSLYERDPAYFRFEGGDGFVMPLRIERNF